MKKIKFTIGTAYPFEGHIKRIKRYRENMQLFKGEYKDIFDKYNLNPNDSLYISVNLAGIICKKSTDMLFGESVQVSAGKKDNSFEQSVLDKITADNYMNISNYEAGLMASIKGDAFYKVRWGQEWEGGLPQSVDPSKVLVEPIPAEYCFPETSPSNKKRIKVVHVCVPVYDEESDRWSLWVESHSAGKVIYFKCNLNVMETDRYGMPTSWEISSNPYDMFAEETGVSLPLVVHVPNFALDSWEGIDDLSEHKSIFDEINNRLSQIAAILDKHADPAIAVPAGVLEVDGNGRPIFSVNREKVFEIMGKDDVIPQYVTWNGQLQHAYSELDRLIENLLATAEIPEVALGKSEAGTSGSTGISIRMRMSPLLAKVNRKRQYFDKALKQVYLIGQQLTKVATHNFSYEPVVPVLIFSDGLPKDSAEEAQTMAIRTGSKPTMSQKSAIMLLDGKTEEQAEAELSRIEAENSVPEDGNPDIFNEITGLNTPNNREEVDADEPEGTVEETAQPTD
ncbi:phage portal protein [Enterococcus gallinarum]|uniref:Phage portal protein n=1 Tax=Enterococcus gallinarum TaxID=1353 RepID=A0ABD4ZSR5_ENTGA|nr:phage portal protein [Enterococcus gallinarum]MDL4875129.1 phage portal protein [Enterococcus gallinarum]MDL4880599.1 phage portal protein [Enterococcus gallinarum]MDL4884148.1 phage portal protein [Enterococcus gallinarum]MDL4892876.1 phage portal protein [Enterococcus gallinarum]MDL4920711.1 phage portal protein [Enterococcus gallinarum]